MTDTAAFVVRNVFAAVFFVAAVIATVAGPSLAASDDDVDRVASGRTG